MRVRSIALGEAVAVLFAQGADLGVGAFLADLAGLRWVLISGAVVEAAGEVVSGHGRRVVWTPMHSDDRRREFRY
jgi:hypothetical protein